jgi:pyruvyltransferase
MRAAAQSAADQLRTELISGTPVAFWNPERKTSVWGRRSLRSRSANNFGDLLGPILVRKLVDELALPVVPTTSGRLLAVGSIIQFGHDADVVWGAGINGKVDPVTYDPGRIDVRATRGPLTAELLRERFGLSVPDIHGDPGLLLPTLFPHLQDLAATKRHDLTVIPNLNDIRFTKRNSAVVSPRQDLWKLVERIAQSRLVVGSSLHGIIVAEALGVPARAVGSARENTFKYDDYFLGTGRDPAGMLAEDVSDAVRRGGAPGPTFAAADLLAAFPSDCWDRSGTAAGAAPVLRRVK